MLERSQWPSRQKPTSFRHPGRRGPAPFLAQEQHPHDRWHMPPVSSGIPKERSAIMSEKTTWTNGVATFVCLSMTVPSLGKRNAYRSDALYAAQAVQIMGAIAVSTPDCLRTTVQATCFFKERDELASSQLALDNDLSRLVNTFNLEDGLGCGRSRAAPTLQVLTTHVLAHCCRRGRPPFARISQQNSLEV
jgi:hypothetical protein